MLNTQRDKVYLERRRALLSADLSPLLLEYAERTVDDILEVDCALQRMRLVTLPKSGCQADECRLPSACIHVLP